MLRIASISGLSVCLWIAFSPASAFAASGAQGVSSPDSPPSESLVDLERCRSYSDVPEPANEGLRWTWRAYHHLDCLKGFLDRALSRESGPEPGDGDSVTLSREELEHLRTLAVWAKDATARIRRN